MATIEIDGVGRVEVDDSFDRLSPEQQQQAVNRIALEARSGRQTGDTRPNTALDVARSGASGFGRGVVGAPGAPGDLLRAARAGVDWVARLPGRAFGMTDADFAENERIVREGRPSWLPRVPGPEDVLPSSRGIQDAVGRQIGGWYEPQTRAGRYARTAGEFAGAATVGSVAGGPLLAPMGVARAQGAATAALPTAGQVVDQTIRYGAVPGLASEAAGQATEGTAAEPWARAGAGLATGLLGGALQARRSAPGQVIEENVGRIAPADMQRAQALIDQARQQGMTLTFPEALASATAGRQNLGPVMATVEALPGGQALRQQMAGRPQEVRQAFDAQMRSIRPQELPPGETVARTARGATAEIDATRDAINQATAPLYRLSRNTPVPQPAYDTLRQMPGFDAALAAVRQHPAIGPTIQNLPANSVGVLDAVRRQLGFMSEQAGNVGNPSFQRQAAGIYDTTRRATRAAATNASPEYRLALDAQRNARQGILEPLERSATGQLARADSMERIQSIIFNPQPARNSTQEVYRAVRSVAQRDMPAAENAVGNSIARIFDEAMQNTAQGPNQFGGARFAAVIAGNDAQARNLNAALNALDPARANGFRRFLEVVDAQQYRTAPNSVTAARQAQMQQMAGTGAAAQVARAALSPARAINFADDLISQWRMRATARDLATIFTSGDVAESLRQLARIRANAPNARTIAAQIIGDARLGAQGAPSQPPIGDQGR